MSFFLILTQLAWYPYNSLKIGVLIWRTDGSCQKAAFGNRPSLNPFTFLPFQFDTRLANALNLWESVSNILLFYKRHYRASVMIGAQIEQI